MSQAGLAVPGGDGCPQNSPEPRPQSPGAGHQVGGKGGEVSFNKIAKHPDGQGSHWLIEVQQFFMYV